MPDQDNDGMYKAHDGTKFLNESEAYNYTQNKNFGESDRANNSYLTDSFTSVIDAQGQAQRNAARAAEDARDAEADRRYEQFLMMGRADELFRRGDLDGALQIYSSLEKVKGHSFAKAGYIYYLKGDNKKALSMYKKSEEDFHSFAPIYRFELYESLGDYGKVLEDCNTIKFSYGFCIYLDKEYDGELLIKIDDIPQRLLTMLTTATEKGVKGAYRKLGDYYHTQFGVKKKTKSKKAETYKKALEYYEKGAEKGDSEAEFEAGKYYYYGYGAARNKKTGLQKIKNAAKVSYEAEEWLKDRSWKRLGVFGYNEDNRMGGFRTFLAALIFAIASGAVGGAIFYELFNLDAWYYPITAAGIGFIISLFAVRLKVLPVIALFLLITIGAGLGIYHSSAVEKGIFIPESISSAFISGGGNAESGQKVKLTPRKVTESATVYSEPSTDSAVVKKLLKGTYINATGKTADGWTPVEHFGDTGWINAGIVKGRGAKVEIAKGDIVFANRRYIKSDDTSAYVYCLATIVEPAMSSGFAKVTYYDGERPTMDEIMQVNFMQNYLNTHYAEGNPLLRMSGRLEILNFNETSAQVQYEDGRTATLPLRNIVFTQTKPK